MGPQCEKKKHGFARRGGRPQLDCVCPGGCFERRWPRPGAPLGLGGRRTKRWPPFLTHLESRGVESNHVEAQPPHLQGVLL